MLFKVNFVSPPAAIVIIETAKYQQQEDLAQCWVVPAVGSRPALWILLSSRLSEREMEVLKWIPEFCNQLQDTLKEWLLASPLFAYNRKPEIKMLIDNQHLSSHSNRINPERFISISMEMTDGSLIQVPWTKIWIKGFRQKFHMHWSWDGDKTPPKNS